MKKVFLFLTILLITISSTAQPSFSIYKVSDDSILKSAYEDVTPVCGCEDLMNLSLPDTKIESAVFKAEDNTCRITAIVNHPPSNDRVTVTLALPVKGWNGRFYGMGGGGFMAGVSFFLNIPVEQGFAAGVTDGGHMGGSGSFALDREKGRLKWQEIRDFAYQGIHDMTLVGKAVVQAYYGKPARYSYFIGGSTGGRQAMMEAQRFPDDYDGILSYFPAINWCQMANASLWPQAVMNDARNYVSKTKLDAVTKAVIAASDGIDGVVDGVIDDPLNCTWDPAEFVGTTVGESVFSKADADVVRKIWEGPRTYDGKFLWYGLTRGTNLFDLSGTKGSPLTGAPFSITMEWFRYFLVLDPEWDIKELSLAEFELLFNQAVDQYTDVIGTDNTDLSGFRDHGGKLIIMHGLADQLIPAQGTISYFEKMQQRMGGAKATSEFARLYLVPGVDHSLFGAGPTPVGQFDALVRWVEQGEAPYRIVAELKDKEGNLLRTRPLFPYPTKAVYSGNGSSDNAENFRPVVPPQAEIVPDKNGFFSIKLREGIYVISNMAWGGRAEKCTPTQNVQLIIGSEKALLIDTSIPKEGFADYVRSITDLPLMVVNSHGHLDHIGNNNQFDEIYIHPADTALLRAHFRNYGKPNFTVKLLNDGDMIDLGNRKVKVYNVPGHTRGSLVFLDKKTSTLITGDAIARRLLYTFGDWTDLSVYFHALERIRKLKFDAILTNHDRFLMSPDLGDRLKKAILDNIETETNIWKMMGTEYIHIVPIANQSDPEYLDIVILKDKLPDAIRDLRRKRYLK